jgi:hypothetical protein
LAARPATRSFGSLGAAHALTTAEFRLVKRGNKGIHFFQKPAAPKSFATADGIQSGKSNSGGSAPRSCRERPQ